MTWQEWCSATLAGIKAPDSPTNHASFTGQMTHEKGYPGGWAQWCNPLNTTQKWNGSVDSGAQPGLHDVLFRLAGPQRQLGRVRAADFVALGVVRDPEVVPIVPVS